MRVKLIVAGIVYFASIWIKSGASNKCYRAKICIHDGKEKCGQDLEGNVRRFLDSCDMKEYNCIQHSNYLKTNSVKCRNLPLHKKPSAYYTVTDVDDTNNKAEQNQDDDNEKVSDVSNMDEVEGDKSIFKGSQDNEDNATNKKDDGDRISKEEVKEANKKDEVVEVDVVIVSDENTSNLENKEDRATEKDEVDRDTEEKESKEIDDDKVHEENEDEIDRFNNSNESRNYENHGQINGMSYNNSSASKLKNKHDEKGKSKEDSDDKVEENVEEGKSKEDSVDKVNVEDGVDEVNDSNEPREDDQANGISKIVTCNCTSKLHNEHDDDEDNRNRSDDVEKPDKLLAENVYDTDESD